MAEDGEPVKLHVYDLSQGMARQMSMSLLGKLIEGIWHTGVVVYGREYWFGGGIQSAPVHAVPYGRPVQTISMGHTEVPRELFEEFLSDIGPRYTMETYSLLKHNCNNFSDEVCQFLTGQGVPSHIIQLPDEVTNSPFGALILPMVEQLETTLRHGGVPQPPRQASGGSGAFPDFGSISLPPPPAAATSATPSLHSALPRPSFLRAANASANASTTAPSPSPTPSTRSPAVAAAAPQAGTGTTTGVPPKSPREFAAAAAEARARTPPGGNGGAPAPPPAATSAAEVPPAVVLAKPPAAKTATVTSTSTASTSATSTLMEAKAKVHEEIRKEFALIMAGGGMQASEAAAEAMKRVIQRHGPPSSATTSAGTNTAGA